MLTEQEQQWLLTRQVSRATDQQEAFIYPMGAERFLSSRLFKKGREHYHYDIRPDVINKEVLIIPGHGNSAFLFARAGATRVVVYDKDPVTIAWMKAFKQYYHYRGKELQGTGASIGEIMDALTHWHLPALLLSPGKAFYRFLRWIHPKALRRMYIAQMISLVEEAVRLQIADEFALNQEIQFYCGEISDAIKENEGKIFDMVFVPYLLGIEHGIETKEGILSFLMTIMDYSPKVHIIVTPTNNKKEFHISGNRYFSLAEYKDLQDVPELKPYLVALDRHWFDTQGLIVFAKQKE